MRDSRRVMLLLAAAVVSWGMAAPQQTARPPAAKPTTAPAARTAAPASSTDPFVGVWKLSAKKSQFESGGAPRSFTRTYEDRGGGTIVMITDAAGSQGPSTRAYLLYKRDGKAYPEASLGADAFRMVTVRATGPRSEDFSYVDEGTSARGSGPITISPDGMTMTQVLSGTTAKGKAFMNTLVFDRQR
ncbi:MAG TPA: hypothetical protein VH436_01990 [Vicinamibacterales bacterium]